MRKNTALQILFWGEIIKQSDQRKKFVAGGIRSSDFLKMKDVKHVYTYVYMYINMFIHVLTHKHV